MIFNLFFKDIFKIISDTEYDPSGNSNYLFPVRADILNLSFLYVVFYIFPCIINAKV